MDVNNKYNNNSYRNSDINCSSNSNNGCDNKDIIKIFGYGTLINEASLRETVPDAKNICLGKVKGYIRVFNIKESRLLTRKNEGDISVLNVIKSNNLENNNYIVGVCFDISVEDIKNLQEREKQYDLREVIVEDYKNKDVVYKAFMWVGNNYEEFSYQFDSIAQKEYLDICLDGCRNFGELFLDEFKSTTLIGNKCLNDINKIK